VAERIGGVKGTKTCIATNSLTLWALWGVFWALAGTVGVLVDDVEAAGIVGEEVGISDALLRS